MDIDSQKMPLARNDITVQVIGEEVMLHDADNCSIHVLNHSAYTVWKLCNGENTIDDICKHMTDTYSDAGSAIADDIQETLLDLRQKMLLV